MFLRPGLRHPVACAAVSRNNRGAGAGAGAGRSRGEGAVPPTLPPSKTIPLLFHIRSATLAPEDIEHESTTFYKITVGAIGNCFWDVYRRYSDFQSLQEKISYLITSFEINAKFPPRHWFSFFVTLTDEEKRQRHLGLEAWLADIMLIATGSYHPPNATTYDVNQLKDCLSSFFEMNENFASALKSTEDETSLDDTRDSGKKEG